MSGMKVWRGVRRGAGWLAGLMLLAQCERAEEAVKDGQPLPGDTAEKAAELDSCEAVVQVEEIEVVATEDTYVNAAIPGATYGGLDKLVVDGDPKTEAYLKFNVTHDHLQGGTLVRAKLQLYAVDGTSDGPALYRAGTEWSEQTLSWNTRPGQVVKLGDLGAFHTSALVEYDVTQVVTEPGTYGFSLVPTSSDGADFLSSESGRARLMPHLDLTVAKSVCTRKGTGGDVSWTRTYGGEGYQYSWGRMAAASDGSFVTVASATKGGNLGGQDLPADYAFALAKYGPDGTHQWSRAYLPFAPYVRVNVENLTLTPLGNILVVGNYTGSPDFGSGPLPPVAEDDVGVFIAKYSPTGNFVWARGFAPTGTAWTQRYANTSAVTSDANGSLIVTGVFVGQLNLGGETFTSAESDALESMFLAKFSWEGDHLWSLAVHAGTSDPFYDSTSSGDVLTDASGRIFVGGSAGTGRLGATAPSTPFVAAYSPEGTLLWSRALNGAEGGVGSLALMPGGAIAFGGSFAGSFTFAGTTLTSPPGGNTWEVATDGLLGVLSASGGDVWARRYGTERTEYFDRIDTDASGNISLLAQARGQFDLGGGPLGHPTGYNKYVARFTSTGTHFWSRVLDPDLGVGALEVTADGGALLVSDFSNPVTLNHQEYLAPGGASELFFLRLTP